MNYCTELSLNKKPNWVPSTNNVNFSLADKNKIVVYNFLTRSSYMYYVKVFK